MRTERGVSVFGPRLLTMPEEKMSVRRLGLLVILVYCFQTTRHITNLYVVILALSVCIFIAALLGTRKTTAVEPVDCLWLSLLFYASFTTLLNADLYGPPGIGLGRLWVSAPLIIVASYLAKWRIDVPLKIVTVFFVMAALSFPLQYAIGPISWFAEASERAGGVRYSSLVGSLTAYGILVAVPAFAALWYWTGKKRVLAFGILALGALMSLQKAALANMALAVCFAFWLSPRRKAMFRDLVVLAILGILGGVIIGIRGGFAIGVRYLDGILTGDRSLTGDVSFYTSILERIIQLPSLAIEYFNSGNLFVGAGAFGGAGALGYDGLPMAHNGLVEVMLIFGFWIGGAMVLAMLVLTGRSLLRIVSCRRSECERNALACTYVLWVINYIFSGGVIFQPIGAIIFWLVVQRMFKLRRNSKRLRSRMQVNAGCTVRIS